MERVPGVILRGVPVPEVMRGLSESFVQTPASIHSIGASDPGIAALGKGSGYVARQVTGRIARWVKARIEPVPEMEELGGWLRLTSRRTRSHIWCTMTSSMTISCWIRTI